jgi:hypothetical protein
MGAKHFHRDRAEIVKNLDLRGSGLVVRRKDSRPEAVPGVVAEFDRGKTKSGSVAQELRAIRHGRRASRWRGRGWGQPFTESFAKKRDGAKGFFR